MPTLKSAMNYKTPTNKVRTEEEDDFKLISFNKNVPDQANITKRPKNIIEPSNEPMMIIE